MGAVVFGRYGAAVHELVGQRLVVLQPGHFDGLGGLTQCAFEVSVFAR